MKKTKRILVVTIVAAILTSMFSMLSVSASIKHAGYLKFDMLDDEVITVSVNVTKTMGNSYIMQLCSPKNVNDPYNTANLYSAGCLRFNADGTVWVKEDSGWVDNDGVGTCIGEIPADGYEYNLKMQFNTITKETSWYIDDEYKYTSKSTVNAASTCSMVIFFDDTEYEQGGLSWRLVSVIGADEGEMKAEIIRHNTDNKYMEIAFSERPKTINGIKLKKVNGDEEIVITDKELVDGTVLKLNYKKELDPVSEYAVVFSDGFSSVHERKVSDNALTFTTDNKKYDVVKASDYENYVNTKDITVMQTAGNQYTVDGGDGYGKALNVDVYSGNAAANNWLNWVAPTGDKTAVSFSIKPLYSDLKMAIEFSNAAMNSTPLYIIFAQNGGIVIGNQWPNAGWYDNAGMNGNWSGDGKSYDYKANEWIDFRVEYTDSEDKAVVYINDVPVKTITGKITDVENIFGGVRFRGMNELREAGIPVLLLDNVKASSFTEISGKATVKASDYESYVNTQDITVLQTKDNEFIVDGNDGYGKSLNVDVYGGSASANQWLNWIQPTGDKTEVAFSIKPLYQDLKMAVEFSNAAMNVTPLYITFAQNGGIVVGNQWPNAGWYDNVGMNGNWSGDGKSYDYKVNEWIDFKVEYTDSEDKAVVYINDVPVKTITGKITDVENIFGGVRFRGMNELRDVGTPVLLLDNVSVSSYTKDSASVTKVIYNDASGNGVSSFDTIDGMLQSVDVYFSNIPDSAYINGNNVKLFSNDKEILCFYTYDSEKGCYTLTPGAGQDIASKSMLKVVVNELKENDKIVLNTYTGYAYADEYKFSVISAFTDSNGTAPESITEGERYFVNINAENTTGSAKSFRVIFAQYNGNRMVDAEVKDIITVDAGNTYNTSFADADEGIFIIAKKDADCIKAFIMEDFTTLKPLTNAASLPIE